MARFVFEIALSENNRFACVWLLNILVGASCLSLGGQSVHLDRDVPPCYPPWFSYVNKRDRGPIILGQFLGT